MCMRSAAGPPAPVTHNSPGSVACAGDERGGFAGKALEKGCARRSLRTTFPGVPARDALWISPFFPVFFSRLSSAVLPQDTRAGSFRPYKGCTEVLNKR